VPARILYLTPGCFDMGGISRYCRYQIQAWREELGHEAVRVLSLAGPGDDAFAAPFEVHWHGSSSLRPRKLDFTRRVVKEALRFRADIIHTAHVNMSGLARAVAQVTGARTLLNIYGLEVWSGLRPDARFGLRASDLVIADCHVTARWVEEARLRADRPTVVIWDCVDLERFSPGRPEADALARYRVPDPASGFNILSFGRMTPGSEYKGYDRLLRAFRLVASHAPEARLVYAGRGSIADDLRRQAREWGLGDRVLFTGMVHDDDLPHVFRAAHVFSLITDKGSGRGEGIPLTPLEAAACGVPILVGDQDGSREAPEHGVSGFVVDPFDLESHAALILDLYRNPARREQMGLAARRRAEAEFGYSRFRAKHARLLRAWLPHLCTPPLGAPPIPARPT
jgi:phosphatidyl-myo-inositol dimannoside synthase